MSKTVVTLKSDIAPLIPRFLENRKTDLKKLEALSAAWDLKGLDDLAHSLKGVAASFGFVGLADLAHRIQLAVQAQDSKEVQRVIGEVSEYLAGLQVTFT